MSAATGTRKARPAVWADLPVAVLLLAGWFTVPAGTVGHVTVGLVFVGWVVLHFLTRPRLLPRLWRAPRSSRAVWPRVATWSAIVSATVMTLSGLVQWAGVEAMIPVHATSSYLSMIAGGWHVWSHRGALRARLRRAG